MPICPLNARITGIKITAIAALFAKLVKINAVVNINATNTVSERPPKIGFNVCNKNSGIPVAALDRSEERRVGKEC